MVKYVLVPSRVKFDIEREISRTFEDDEDVFEVVHLYDGVHIDNYANPMEIALLLNVMKEKVQEVKSKLTEEDEVYVIASGSAFHSIVAGLILKSMGLKFKVLVYEKKVAKYVAVEV